MEFTTEAVTFCPPAVIAAIAPKVAPEYPDCELSVQVCARSWSKATAYGRPPARNRSAYTGVWAPILPPQPHAGHPTSRYRLGWRIMQLAGGVTEATVLRRAAPAKMRKLAELGQSTHLAVWDGRDMFFFARAVALKGVAMATATPGTTLPAHATASGKVLLGHLRSEASLARMLDGALTRLTDRTIVDESELWHEVASARESGLAVSREETVEDVDALAVPVRGTDGRVVAALGVSVRAGELDGYLACNRQHVLATAAALSAEVRRMSSEVVARSAIRGLALEV